MNQRHLDSLCPNPECGGVVQFIKSWKMKGKGKHAIVFRLYKCQKCGASFRTHNKEE